MKFLNRIYGFAIRSLAILVLLTSSLGFAGSAAGQMMTGRQLDMQLGLLSKPTQVRVEAQQAVFDARAFSLEQVWQDFQTELIEILRSAVKRFLNIIIDTVISKIQELLQQLLQMLGSISGLAANFFGPIVEAIVNVSYLAQKRLSGAVDAMFEPGGALYIPTPYEKEIAASGVGAAIRNIAEARVRENNRGASSSAINDDESDSPGKESGNNNNQSNGSTGSSNTNSDTAGSSGKVAGPSLTPNEICSAASNVGGAAERFFATFSNLS